MWIKIVAIICLTGLEWVKNLVLRNTSQITVIAVKYWTWYIYAYLSFSHHYIMYIKGIEYIHWSIQNGRQLWFVNCILIEGLWFVSKSLRWRHNDHAGVSNHQPPGCLLNRLFRRKSKKTSKLRVTGLCAGNSPGTGEFSAQMASYAENVSIWWRHHVWACTYHG